MVPRTLIRPTESANANWACRQAHAQLAYARAARGLTDELDALGFAFERLSDLRTKGFAGHRALPILLAWLPRVRNVDLKVDIVLALSARWSVPGAFPLLIQEYWNTTGRDFDSGRIRAAICTTLERIADDTIASELSWIAANPTFGIDRGMAIVALGNLTSHRTEAVELLVALLDDRDVTLYAILGLAKLGATEAEAAINRQRGHRNPIVRHTARKTVQRWMIAARQNTG